MLNNPYLKEVNLDFLDALSDSAIVFDVLGRFYYANTQFQFRFGDLITDTKIDFTLYSRTFSKIIPELKKTSVRRKWQQYIEKESTFSIFDEENHVDYSFEYLKYSEGHFYYLIFIKNNENKQSHLNAKALLDNEKMATIGRLSTGIIHELNNPLDATRRFLNLANEHISLGQSELARDSIRSANDGIKKMIQIVKSLLSLSRYSFEKNETRNNLIDVMNQSIAGFDEFFQNSQVTCSFDKAVEEVFVNDVGLLHVFNNIIRNAIQAIEAKGSIKIRVQVFDDEQLSQVEVSIEDSGKGIPPEDIQKIFEPFYTTKKKEGGAGLGLSICKEILQKSDGTIKIMSQQGKGTICKIILPVITSPNLNVMKVS